MASNGKWTVVFEDRLVIKRNDDFTLLTAKGLVVGDEQFWSQTKFSNIWAIQYGTSNPSDEVEHRDNSPHCSYAEANLGPITQFTDLWDAAHLADIQERWDNDTLTIKEVVDGENVTRLETIEEKITRLGARPTNYVSTPV